MRSKAKVKQLTYEHKLQKKLAESASYGVWNGVNHD